MKLFHIHKPNKYDELYVEGNTFVVGLENNILRNSFLKNSCTYIDRVEDDNGRNIKYHKSLTDLVDLDLFDKITEQEKIEYFDLIKNYLRNSMIDFREIILEEIRFKCYNNLPSRYKCMWLTDEDGLETWAKYINASDDSKVFEVDIDGNLFVSRDSLLPKSYVTHEIMYKEGFHYWNPTKKDLEDASDREYLFEGNVKLLRRVK